MKSPAPSRPQKMALIPACIFLCFAALSVQAEETPVTPQPPDILLGPLFNDVQNAGNDSNLLIVFYVQIMPDDFVMQLHRF